MQRCAASASTRLLSYQVADAVKAKKLVVVLRKFEPAPLPVSLVYVRERRRQRQVARIPRFRDAALRARSMRVGSERAQERSGIVAETPRHTGCSGAVAAVHRDAGASDEDGALAREECDRCADLFRSAISAERGAGFLLLCTKSLSSGFISVSMGPG